MPPKSDHGVPVLDPRDMGLVCPLSLGIYNDPVRASDGKVYERADIEMWMEVLRRAGHELTSPLTRERLTAALTPVPEIKKRAKEWRQEAKNAGVDELHARPPRLQTLNSTIFTDLDVFQSTPLIAQLNLREPCVIAVGNENVGKSTILERITGFPVLPRATTLCTRMVLRIHLRRGPYKPARVVLRDRTNNNAEVPGSEMLTALDSLCAVVQEKMDAKVAEEGVTVVTNFEQLIEITLDYCPNLNFIDLPGLVATDLQGGNAKEATRELAKSVMEAEKGYATYLLVCDGRTRVNLSLAAGLVRECDVASNTIGVLTQLDLVVGADGDETASMAVARTLEAATTDLPLANGWLGSANKKPGARTLEQAEGSKEVFRLHKMEYSERECIAKWRAEDEEDKAEAFTEAVASRVGIQVVRQKTQALFEKFITQQWVPTIRTKLLAHFDEGCVKNRNLGVPIPNTEAYVSVLTYLNQHSASVVPNFDVGLLRTQTDDEFKVVLLSVLRGVVSHPTQDWMGLKGIAALWNPVKALAARPAQQTASWGSNAFFYLDAQAKAEAEKKWLKEEADKIVRALVSFTKSQLSKRLIDTLFAEPPAPADRTVFDRARGRWDRFWGNSSGASGESFDQQSYEVRAALSRLARFPDLKVKFGKDVNAKFAALAAKYSDAATAAVGDKLRDCVSLTYDAAGATLQCKVQYEDQRALEHLGHRLVQLWIETVVLAVEGEAQRWQVPASSRKETTEADRLKALGQMKNAVAVLLALKDLQERIEKEAP